jgi:hypothetical protein
MRVSEDIGSDVVRDLMPGTLIKIVKRAAVSNRRIKASVCSKDHERQEEVGWISICTQAGEPLVGKVDSEAQSSVTAKQTEDPAFLPWPPLCGLWLLSASTTDATASSSQLCPDADGDQRGPGVQRGGDDIDIYIVV